MQIIDTIDESTLSEDEKFRLTLTKAQKTWIFDKQQELFNSGFSQDQHFIKLSCYNEAVRLFKLNPTCA